MELATRKFEKIPIYCTNTVFFTAPLLFTAILQLISQFLLDNVQNAEFLLYSLMILLYTAILVLIRRIDDDWVN